MDIGELEQLIQLAAPEACLVPPRLLRRIIKRHRNVAVIGLQVPHRKSHVIDRESLLQIVTAEELGLHPDGALPDTLFLLARPDPERLAETPRGQTLIKFWRLLFHCRVHEVVQRRFADGAVGEPELRRRIDHLGQAQFAEIRRVLRQEKYLVPPVDNRNVYEEFAACYLELRFFVPALLPNYFPAFDDYDRVDRILAEDVDALALFGRTRLQGAPDPVLTGVTSALEAARESEPESSNAYPAPTANGALGHYLDRADRAEASGNVVRSAILMEEAAQAAPAQLAREMRAAANTELGQLTARLRAVLELNPSQAAEWHRAVIPLLEPAARGIWPAAARLLYDLQKVCIDHERGIYAVDLVEWALSLGKRPVKRPLPNQHEVLIVKHLRKALGRLPRVRLADPDRQRLTSLLRAAIHHSEMRLRDKLRPLMVGVFDKVGMTPANYPEKVARAKLIEELLDRITERGFINIGDLRDAISRNDLKLPDLRSVGEFFGGDLLLRINHEFSYVLDGVYRRGEIYMRWLQKFSSLAFGTRVGRFLTRYLALPFGGAFVLLEFLQHMVGHLIHATTGYHLHFMNRFSVPLLGVFFFGLLYVDWFRQGVGAAFRGIFYALRAVFVRFPLWLARLPWIVTLLQSPPLVLFLHYLFIPLLFTGVVAGIFHIAGGDPNVTLWATALTFLGAFLIVNTRAGRDLEETVSDWFVRGWEYFRTGVLPGLFHAVMNFFKTILELVERFLYSVDEWLRFRSGEGMLSLVIKAVLGVLWFYITYFVRFAFNLLLEPQVNPIKHFPVVTVSHKLIFPTYPSVGTFIASTMGLTEAQGKTIALSIIWGIPGIFGFFVWELKENWKLYEANRSPTLGPISIGHHGETMLQLMKPGFHSGTLPKIYARLRKAERRAYRPRQTKAAHIQREALHHVEEAIRHFVDREFVNLLRESRSWHAATLACAEIELGSNRIRIEMCCPELGKTSLWLAFEEDAGWLVAGILAPGWLHQIAPDQARALRMALAGLYKYAGVHLIREEIAASFEPRCPPFAVVAEGLVVWPDGKFRSEALYDLTTQGMAYPRTTGDFPTTELPVLDPMRVVYKHVPLTWPSWVEAWQQDQTGKGIPDSILEEVHFYPPPRRDLVEEERRS